ncbi:hypothetical protein [Rhodococcus erythropolis]|uniref:Uncharacterized protein n=1 Tax=Rhodococcus erythropolis TaxID=1833 RepID=A0AAX3ZZX8_RHOER|nr:hypothetical protein [Rhodococcus erythropolis]WMN03097.1 hypothetical protein QIE55_32335 [Rhodococcus erythropolis]
MQGEIRINSTMTISTRMPVEDNDSMASTHPRADGPRRQGCRTLAGTRCCQYSAYRFDITAAPKIVDLLDNVYIYQPADDPETTGGRNDGPPNRHWTQTLDTFRM